MKKCITLLIIPMLCPFIAHANIRPLMTASVGVDQTSIYRNTTILMLTPFTNTYTGIHKSNTQAVGGLFLGAESKLSSLWGWQYGIRYFQTHAFNVRGNVYQFSDPLYNNLTYQYRIENRRVLAESKLLITVKTKYHPYVVGALGESFNRAYGYHELPISSADAPMTQPFANTKTSVFSYSLGLGVDMELTQHVRLGLNYRWSQLGKASLGKTPLQDGTTTITHAHLPTNEFLLEVGYLV
ncbi:MAG: outer membrane protein [Legionellales bacterium]